MLLNSYFTTFNNYNLKYVMKDYNIYDIDLMTVDEHEIIKEKTALSYLYVTKSTIINTFVNTNSIFLQKANSIINGTINRKF